MSGSIPHEQPESVARDQLAEDARPDVVQLIPPLRAYARALTRNAADADDLVQETLCKALANLHRFQPGTHLRAWLFTIMRNSFYTRAGRAKREVTGGADCVSGTLTSEPTQEWSLRGKELMAAVSRLPVHYRETLVMVVMLGESYETAAGIFGCTIGTIKSRVNRARTLVRQDLGDSEV